MENDTLMTPEGLADLERELEQLIGPGRDEMAERIKVARELGDLKENAEYHAAKESQAFLETRILTIQRQIRTAKVVEHASNGTVTLGSTVVIREDGGPEETWTITGVNEADPMENRISYESPIGSALMEKAVGDVVEVQLPRGEMRIEVVRVD
jgi:transcription elongation factor GreA